MVLVEVECGEHLAGVEQTVAYFAYSFHVGFDFHTHLLSEYVYEFDSGAAEPPPNHQMLVSRISTPLRIAIIEDARP